MPGEWIEIREPRTQEAMFANLETGECTWEPPPSSSSSTSTSLNAPPEDQWWELLDERTSRYYYYNVKTGETRWERPVNNRAKIIALHRLIKRRCDKSVQTETQVKFSCDVSTQTHSVGSHIGGNSAIGPSLREYLVNEARYAGINFDYSSNDEDAHGGICEDWDADDECDEDEIETEDEDEENEDYDDDDGAVGDDDDEDDEENDEEDEDDTEENSVNVIRKEDFRRKTEVPKDNIIEKREITPRNKIIVAKEEAKYDEVDAAKKDEKLKQDTKDEKVLKVNKNSEKQLESYAKENIRRHLKKGGVNVLLKRRESMRRMLIWTKDPIKQPMIATLEQNLRQEAILCFKLIQQFCGDRTLDSGFTSTIDVALELLSKGVAHGPLLRDELFVQLCRQTSENPSNESCERGLLLITLFLFYFSPSAKFAPYLTTFLEQHTLLTSTLKTVAQTTLKKRISTFEECDTFQVTGGFTKRPGGISELQMVMDSIENGETGWFGFSLEQTLDKQQEEEEYLNHFNSHQGDHYQEDPYRRRKRLLPWLQVHLSELILRLGGSSTEGIFRVAPDFEEMASVRLYIETHSMAENLVQQYERKDVHIFASLLKQWFRQLRSPVIPIHLYHKCLELCESPQCIIIVDQLPAINRLVLGHLIRFLQVFAAAQNVARTKMDDNNLSMVWSPNILRSPTSSMTPSTLFENTRKEMLFIRSLIQRLDTNFVQGIY